METAALALGDGSEEALCFDVVTQTTFCAGEADREIAKLLGFGCVDRDVADKRAEAEAVAHVVGLCENRRQAVKQRRIVLLRFLDPE